ncbi:hypothetical protein BDW68DRAFT_165963 [Aspergillus falconensis]
MSHRIDPETEVFYQDFERALGQAVLGLNCVFGAASLGCGIGALVIRRRHRAKFSFGELPEWTVIGFLFANFLFAIFATARWGMVMTDQISVYGSTARYYYTGEILPYFFLYGGNCALIYILYYFLRLVSTGCPKVQTPSSRLERIHWALVWFMVVISMVEWGLLTKYQLLPHAEEAGATPESLLPFRKAYAGFDSAVYFIRLMVSIEILYWTINLNVRTLGKGNRRRALSIFLLIASTFYFALNLTWAVWDIRWLLVPAVRDGGSSASGGNAYYAANICQVIFYICIYIGVIPFCLRWGLLAKEDEKAQAAKEEKDDREKALLPPGADSEPRKTAEIAEVEGGARVRLHEMDSPQVWEADSAAVAEVDSGSVATKVMLPVELDSTEVTR